MVEGGFGQGSGRNVLGVRVGYKGFSFLVWLGVDGKGRIRRRLDWLDVHKV